VNSSSSPLDSEHLLIFLLLNVFNILDVNITKCDFHFWKSSRFVRRHSSLCLRSYASRPFLTNVCLMFFTPLMLVDPFLVIYADSGHYMGKHDKRPPPLWKVSTPSFRLPMTCPLKLFNVEFYILKSHLDGDY